MRHLGSLAAGAPLMLSVCMDAVAVRRLPKVGAGAQIIGLTAPYDVPLPSSYQELTSTLDGKELASSASVILVTVYGRPDIPCYPLAVLPESGCTAETTRHKYHIIFELFRQLGAAVLSMGADGADLSAMQSYSAAPADGGHSVAVTALSPTGQLYTVRLRAFRCKIKVSWYQLALSNLVQRFAKPGDVECTLMEEEAWSGCSAAGLTCAQVDIPVCMRQDDTHILTKFRSRLLKGVILASHRVNLENLQDLLPERFLAEELRPEYYVQALLDPMNVFGAAAVCASKVLAALETAQVVPAQQPPPALPELTEETVAALIKWMDKAVHLWTALLVLAGHLPWADARWARRRIWWHSLLPRTLL